MDKDKIINRAQALSSLEGNEGWKIVEGLMLEAVETSKNKVFDSKKVKTWDDYLYYKAKYDAFSSLLFLIKRWKEQGNKLQQEQDNV